MAKHKPEQTDFSDAKVTLKPLFGIKPEYYLPVVYIILIILVCFIVFFLPGITKHGTYITFKTVPGKTPVYVDNVYVGSTPCTAFVRSGKREITLDKPYYKKVVFTSQVKGGLFATLIFPEKATIVRSLEVEDPAGHVRWAIGDIAQFGMLKSFTANYQYPPLITDATSVLFAAGDEILPSLSLFQQNAMGFVDSEQELRDFVHSFSITGGENRLFSSYSVVRMAKQMLTFMENHRGFPCWIAGALSKARSIEKKTESGIQETSLYELYVDTDWFKKYFAGYKASLARDANKALPNPVKSTTIVKGISFVSFPGTSFVMGNTTGLKSSMYPDMENLPHPVTLSPFSISATEITNRDFFAFTRANPEWLPANRDQLTLGGLTTEEYLSHWVDEVPAETDLLKPVTNISFYAARAYCEWLTGDLASTLNNYEVRLPSEAEWEYVARSIEAQINPSLLFPDRNNQLNFIKSTEADPGPVFDMFGSVWEWCTTWFLPQEYPLSSPEYRQSLESDIFIGSEKSVRGGSWANSKADNIRSFTRGSQPPVWCTPYLGFRVVLAEKSRTEK